MGDSMLDEAVEDSRDYRFVQTSTSLDDETHFDNPALVVGKKMLRFEKIEASAIDSFVVEDVIGQQHLFFGFSKLMHSINVGIDQGILCPLTLELTESKIGRS